jgi:DNA processing protein
MSPDPELLAWLRLGLAAELSPAAFRKLLAEFGDPESVCNARHGDLVRFVSADTAKAILEGPEPSRMEEVLAWVREPANGILTLADAEYPRSLLEIPDPPPLLYAKGDISIIGRPALAIVGSRNATPQGCATAEEFARDLSNAGLAIISGLAVGIDAAAHRGGLEGKSSTIAVVGTGLDIVYPARNRDLAHRIAADGILVSEFALGTPARAGNFPRRNRLISGLARGCLVVEAAFKSGSLITARCAIDQGREVFAIPGSIHSPLSKGCHMLIKQGAKLVESSADVLDELGMSSARDRGSSGTEHAPAGDAFLESLGFDPFSIDSLCARNGLTAESASAMLLGLELDGIVSRLPDGRFQRVR